MAKMNEMKQKITKATDAELVAQLAEVRATLRSERFAAAGSRPKDSNSPKKLKKTVARILTEKRARELAHSTSSGQAAK
jgi:ribosomal protein L29